jgi:hypothetical protein
MTDAQGEPAEAQLPFGIDRDTHVLRTGHSPWPRRVAIAVMLVFIVLGLLNTFGQVFLASTADAPAASLRVDAPVRLRGGDLFTSVFTVTPHRKLNDAKLRLSPDWFNGITLNAEAPQSQQESSDLQGTTYDYGELDAGAAMPVWISWQVNPNTLGIREQAVTLFDGDQPLVTVSRTLTVFP